MIETEPILRVMCDEPEGLFERHIYPMTLSPENLRTFWEKARSFHTVFGEEISEDFKKFAELFISKEGDDLRAHGLFWKIDAFVGVYYMTKITAVEAFVHYSFFDRRARGREALTHEMIKYVFERYGFWRLNAEIPMYAGDATFGFVRAVGFKKEGRKRKAIEYKGERFDVACFGILREEVLNGKSIQGTGWGTSNRVG